MKWERARKSRNVEDRRGRSVAKAGGGLGLVGMAIVVIVSLVLGKNPLEMLGLANQLTGVVAPSSTQTSAPPRDDEASRFVASILGETEDVWSALFQQAGQRYQPPTLVLYTDRVQSACGTASSAVGPFYCPGDQQIYIDLSFFQQMRTRLGGGGDFAEAYVIAHEVGHHIQSLTGVLNQVNDARRRGQNIEGDGGLAVRQELQADCYSGVWAHHAQARHDWLEPGDIEEALNTAAAIGDDRLQRQSRGTVVPDSFTHGTSEQRVRWFKIGFEGGQFQQCDAFGASRL